MRAEHPLLNIARAVIVVEIETGLADADDPRMFGQRGQLIGRRSPRARPLRADAPRPSTRRRRTPRRWRAPPGTGRAACRSSASCRRRRPGRGRSPHRARRRNPENRDGNGCRPACPLPSPGRRVAVNKPRKDAARRRYGPPRRKTLFQLGKIACISGHRELVEQCSGRVGHKRLHQDPEMAQNLSQSIKNRLHPLGITASAAPTAPAHRHSGWRRRPPARSSPAQCEKPARRPAAAPGPEARAPRRAAARRLRRTSPGSGIVAAAVAVDHAQHALRQIAEIIRQVAVSRPTIARCEKSPSLPNGSSRNKK